MGLISGLFETLLEGLTALISLLPSSPFSFSSYVEALEDYLPILNYFVPFYLMAPVMLVCILAFFSSIAVIVVIKLVQNKIMK